MDEADYVVGNARIMETLRDIYDATEQPLILVGMEEIVRRISQRKQLFNRISQWIEFNLPTWKTSPSSPTRCWRLT